MLSSKFSYSPLPLLRPALLLCLFFVAGASAQTNSTITGVVLDPQGAVIAGAKITARSLETNLTRTTQSDSEGRFVFQEMRVGAYEIRAEENGFKAWSRESLALTLGETAVVHIVLEPSALAEKLNVSASDNAPLVNTTTPELSYLVGERAIREL